MSRLTIAVSSRALFDFEDAHRIFDTQGIEAYRKHRDETTCLPKPGGAFPIVKSLAAMADAHNAPVEIVVISRNTATTGLPVVRAIEDAGLHVPKAVFTGGAKSLVPYLQAFETNLFLTRTAQDAAEAVANGIPAALMYDPPADFDPHESEIRIAFDGDSVLFSDEGDRIFEERGLAAFMDHEREHAARPLPKGPMAPFLEKLGALRSISGHGGIRVALITARIGPARERAMATLKTWGVDVDEAHFLGSETKAKFVAVFRPHIFFDDRHSHLEHAALLTPSARVPSERDDGVVPRP